MLLSSTRNQDRGVGFGVNNAVARIGGLLSIAFLPVVSHSILAAGASQGNNVTHLFSSAAWFATVLCLCSVASGVLGLRNRIASLTDLRWLV